MEVVEKAYKETYKDTLMPNWVDLLESINGFNIIKFSNLHDGTNVILLFQPTFVKRVREELKGKSEQTIQKRLKLLSEATTPEMIGYTAFERFHNIIFNENLSKLVKKTSQCKVEAFITKYREAIHLQPADTWTYAQIDESDKQVKRKAGRSLPIPGKL
jgi:hypothetical protein